MNIRTLAFAAATTFAILSGAGCSSESAPGSSAPSAESIPAVTASTIVLDSGRVITIPEGVDVLRSGWTYKNFTAPEALEIAHACKREHLRLLADKAGTDIPKPMAWVCRQAMASSANFKK